MKPTLLILAAGMGSRYGGLKQIDGVGPSGETIMDYSIYDAVKAGFGKVVFVIRKRFEEEFKSKVSSKYKDIIDIDHVYQEVEDRLPGLPEIPREKPWGTGHAVLVAKDAINEPFAVINADDYYGRGAYEVMANFLSNQVTEKDYAMIGYYLSNTLSKNGTVSRGVCTSDQNNHLTDVVERTKIGRNNDGKIYYDSDTEKQFLKEDTIVSMNFWGFHQNIFSKIENHFREFALENKNDPKAEFYIPLYVNRLLKNNEITMSVLESDSIWFGVTYKEDRPEVVNAFKNLVEKGSYPSPLW